VIFRRAEMLRRGDAVRPFDERLWEVKHVRVYAQEVEVTLVRAVEGEKTVTLRRGDMVLLA